MVIWVGIDDTDTYDQGCTTFVMYRMLKEFLKTHGEWRVWGYPRLIRLNPNIPFKTRGNAAVAVGLLVDDEDYVLELAKWAVDNYSYRVGKTSPGVVISRDNTHHWIYWKAVSDIIPLDTAKRWATKLGVRFTGGRGIIGALAAVMADLSQDSTIELLAYVEGGKVNINEAVVNIVDEATSPFTFENIGDGDVLIQPHGNDPVLFGIRGDSPYHVLYAASMLLNSMDIKPMWLMYMTNQATGHHMRIMGTRPYNTTTLSGLVDEVKAIEGGNFMLKVGQGRLIAYRHYGFSHIDKVKYVSAYGGLKPGIEGIDLYMEGGIAVLEDVTVANPRCPKCGGRLSSIGRDGWLKCPRCGFKTTVPRVVSYNVANILEEPRGSEIRHLHKPMSRMGLEGLASILMRPSLWIV